MEGPTHSSRRDRSGAVWGGGQYIHSSAVGRISAGRLLTPGGGVGGWWGRRGRGVEWAAAHVGGGLGTRSGKGMIGGGRKGE